MNSDRQRNRTHKLDGEQESRVETGTKVDIKYGTKIKIKSMTGVGMSGTGIRIESRRGRCASNGARTVDQNGFRPPLKRSFALRSKRTASGFPTADASIVLKLLVPVNSRARGPSYSRSGVGARRRDITRPVTTSRCLERRIAFTSASYYVTRLRELALLYGSVTTKEQ
ncbi:hypothetical protein EVAR_21636_1 [Eumeta japonica]|uniref:Uncharacterized protein n=1 Tax=Eumeta variegata TaxID=151549 RepID=A0A4C1UXL3_EUMVA|nr:hypothetical protein EVAR_21636_1 [Eumeta japonica]